MPACSIPSTLWDQRAKLLSPWDFPDENTGVGGHFLLQGIFLTQGSNASLLNLLHWRADSHCPTWEPWYCNVHRVAVLWSQVNVLWLMITSGLFRQTVSTVEFCYLVSCMFLDNNTELPFLSPNLISLLANASKIFIKNKQRLWLLSL